MYLYAYIYIYKYTYIYIQLCEYRLGMLYKRTRRISHHTVPNSDCPPSLTAKFFSQVQFVYRLLGEPPLGQSSPKRQKLIPDNSQKSMQSFTPLSFSATKSVTVQTNRQKQTVYPNHTTVWYWWDNNNIKNITTICSSTRH